MTQLNALDPVPSFSLGDFALLAPEAGRSPKGLTLTIRTENGHVVDQRTVAVGDIRARRTTAQAIAGVCHSTVEDIESALLNLGAAAELQMRNKVNRASTTSAGADRYAVVDGRMCYIEYVDGEQRSRPLCNFAARIVEETTRDDGQEITRQYVIEAILDSGETLPRCRVDAQSFGSMNWVSSLGVRAIVHAGQTNRDRLREAIQQHSINAVTHRHVYTHTGWREISGRRVFLTAGGALGDPDVQVELDGALLRYRLPAEVPGVPVCREGMAASLRMLNVAPHRITMPLCAVMFGAPLAELLHLDFSAWPVGPTGVMKTTLAVLALANYGDFSDITQLPSWESTENALEKLSFLAKDVPLLVDDVAPQATAQDL